MSAWLIAPQGRSLLRHRGEIASPPDIKSARAVALFTARAAARASNGPWLIPELALGVCNGPALMPDSSQCRHSRIAPYRSDGLPMQLHAMHAGAPRRRRRRGAWAGGLLAGGGRWAGGSQAGVVCWRCCGLTGASGALTAAARRARFWPCYRSVGGRLAQVTRLGTGRDVGGWQRNRRGGQRRWRGHKAQDPERKVALRTPSAPAGGPGGADRCRVGAAQICMAPLPRPAVR